MVISAGSGGSFSYNQSKSSSHYAAITDVSGTGTGSGGFYITVGGNTHLVGRNMAQFREASRRINNPIVEPPKGKYLRGIRSIFYNRRLMSMMLVIALAVTTLLCGCVTMRGTYRLSVVDTNGKDLAPGLFMTAEGRGIYSVRNAMCAVHPGATVLIVDTKTGQSLKGESPYLCRK